jgi:hypothetical protein
VASKLWLASLGSAFGDEARRNLTRPIFCCFRVMVAFAPDTKIKHAQSLTGFQSLDGKIKKKMAFMVSLQLVFWLILCLVNLYQVFMKGYESDKGLHGLQRWPAKKVLNYIYEKQFPVVDVVILAPFVMSKDRETNYSALSIFRFAPWVRRLHVLDPEGSEPTESDAADHWRDHQRSRIVHTRQDLLTYSLTSPYLSQHFFVLKPHYVLSNYLFSWHLFVSGSPVHRNFRTGLLPLTREIFNECVYRPMDEAQRFSYAVWKAVQTRAVKYEDNRDHFSSSHTTRLLVAEEDEAAELLKFEEVAKNRDAPFRLTLFVVDQYDADLKAYDMLPEAYDARIQIWIYISSSSKPSAQLSFVHRMVVNKNLFLEIVPTPFPTTEALGAEVMRRLRQFSKQQEFQVEEVLSPGPQEAVRCNDVAQKLATAYHAPYTVMGRTKREHTNLAERKRLAYL